jgi:biopolymer transport protein ExbD
MARRHASGNAQAEIELPITPMLDMSFQLLAFFIFTFHPAATIEGQMDFSLPATGDARAKQPDQVDMDRPSDTELSPKGALTVTIKTHPTNKNGEISHINVQMPNGGRELPFNTPEEMAKYLETVRDSLENKNDIQIQADSGLKYSKVIRVIDLCRAAKFEGIGFAPPPDQPTPKE